MRRENRKAERFSEMGRVESRSLCALPGVLDDISLTGCKVHFPVPLTPDMENDYTLLIKPSRGMKGILELLCHPQWIRHNGTETELGFKILTNHNVKALKDYINSIEKTVRDSLDISNFIVSHDFTIVR